MKLKGITDSTARPVHCPKCGTLLMYTARNAEGTIYPYCKFCKVNIKYDLSAVCLSVPPARD